MHWSIRSRLAEQVQAQCSHHYELVDLDIDHAGARPSDVFVIKCPTCKKVRRLDEHMYQKMQKHGLIRERRDSNEKE